MGRKIKFGIIGAGNIAHRFAKALQYENMAELYAISGRNEAKLLAFKREFPCNKLYLSYQALIDDENIDAIYIALPHNLHKEWTIKALQAKKAVLLEKPAALNAQEMLEIKTAAINNNTLFMEAQKARFTPLYRQLKQFIDSGEFGKLMAIETSLCNKVPALYLQVMQSYLYKKDVGGALLDVGTYCASFIEDFSQGELYFDKIEATRWNDVDIYTKCDFHIGETKVRLECALDRAFQKYAIIKLAKAEIMVEDLHRPTQMKIIQNGSEKVIKMDYEYDDFYSQIHHFVDLLQKNIKESPLMSLDSSIKIAKILDFVKDNALKDGQDTPLLMEELMSSAEVLAQEKAFRFQAFNNDEAYILGNMLVECCKALVDQPIRIRIYYADDIVFQYLMEGKKGDKYLQMKQAMVMELGHSTWYVTRKMLEQDRYYLDLLKNQQAFPCGGGFPIFVNEELKGAILVSGLSDALDHRIIISSLEKYFNRRKEV